MESVKEEVELDNSNRKVIDTDIISIGGIGRGLSRVDYKTMTVGQVVDYCITYNDMYRSESDSDENNNSQRGTTRKATQADWDRFARS